MGASETGVLGGRTDGAVRYWELELFEIEIFPKDVAGRAAVDLESEEAFGSEVFFVGVDEVGAEFAVEPSLQVVASALDDDGVPVVPLEELFALGGEGGEFFFRCFATRGNEPSPALFIEDAGGPAALGIFHFVVLALVTLHAAIGEFCGGLFVKAAEHAAGVAVLIDELELEGEDEVAVFLFGAEEGVAFDVFAKAADGSVFDFVFEHCRRSSASR